MSNRYHILPADFFELPLWQRARRYSEAEAYLDLKSNCAFRITRLFVGRQQVDLQPGEQIATLQGLAERWRWDRRTVRSYLRELSVQGLLTVTCQGPVMVLMLSTGRTVLLKPPALDSQSPLPLPPADDALSDEACPPSCHQSNKVDYLTQEKEVIDSGFDLESKTQSNTTARTKKSAAKPSSVPRVVTDEDLLPPWVPDPAVQFPPDYPIHEYAEHLRSRLTGKGHIRYRGTMMSALRREFEQKWLAEHPDEAARLGIVDGGTPADAAPASPGEQEQAA